MRPWFQAWWTTFRFRHLVLELLVALSLAFLVWLYTHSRDQNSIDHVQVPVQIQLNPSQRDQYFLETTGTQKVSVSFSGPSMRIRDIRRKLQRGMVQANLTLLIPEERLNEAVFSDTLRVEAEHIAVPPGILAEITDDTPTITVSAHRLTERLLPVKLDYTGEVRVTQMQVEPAAVLVRGPKQVLDHAQALNSRPYALASPTDGATETEIRGQATLASELEGRAIQATPRAVNFRCKVQPRQKIYHLRDVPIHFLCPAQFPWKPRFADERAGKVELRLLGPASEETPPVLAFIDLTASQPFRGRNLEALRLQLPKDFTLVQAAPQVIAFYLDELTVSATAPREQP
ncbi:MAG: hypothetical protein HY040_14435 [Planctomycetes bacterium]|nr:hypothetical protein [Planctomycetota bacterium]